MSNGDLRSDETSENITISTKHVLELERLALLRGLEDDLDDWAKKRFRTALIAITVVGFVGIQAIGYLIIDTTMGDQIDNAKVQGALLKHDANRIREEGNKVIVAAEIATIRSIAKLKDLEKQANKLDVRFNLILGEGILSPGGEENKGKVKPY